MRTMVEDNMEEFTKAVTEDLRRPYGETVLAELYDVVGEIVFFNQNLEAFSAPEVLPTPLAQKPMSFEVSRARVPFLFGAGGRTDTRCRLISLHLYCCVCVHLSQGDKRLRPTHTPRGANETINLGVSSPQLVFCPKIGRRYDTTNALWTTAGGAVSGCCRWQRSVVFVVATDFRFTSKDACTIIAQ